MKPPIEEVLRRLRGHHSTSTCQCLGMPVGSKCSYCRDWERVEVELKKMKTRVCGTCFNKNNKQVWNSSIIPYGGYEPCPVCQPPKEEPK